MKDQTHRVVSVGLLGSLCLFGLAAFWFARGETIVLWKFGLQLALAGLGIHAFTTFLLSRILHGMAVVERGSNRLDETIQRTLIGLSHELRNPLTVIAADLDLLRKDLPAETRQEVASETQEAVDRMTRLVTDLGLFLRAEAGLAQPSLTEVEVVEFVGQVVARFVSKASGGQVLFFPSEGSHSLRARLDSDLAERVLNDLITNGLLYSQTERVDLSVFPLGPDSVAITVRDQGCGIDQIHHEKIFEQFYRLESSRDRGSGGVGLGLPLARALTRAQRGELFLLSRPGEGTEVRIVLPRA